MEHFVIICPKLLPGPWWIHGPEVCTLGLWVRIRVFWIRIRSFKKDGSGLQNWFQNSSKSIISFSCHWKNMWLILKFFDIEYWERKKCQGNIMKLDPELDFFFENMIRIRFYKCRNRIWVFLKSRIRCLAILFQICSPELYIKDWLLRVIVQRISCKDGYLSPTQSHQ